MGLAAVAELGVDAGQVDRHRARLSVAERYDGAVIGRWHGKPVQHRRGPATVTGEVHRTRRRGAGHWLAIASREGAAGSARKPGDLRRPHAHIDPRGKGLATHATHPFGPLGARSAWRSPARSPRCSAQRVTAVRRPRRRRARRARRSPSASKDRKQTLVRATAVTLERRHVVKDGVAADSCSGLSAAGALELATRGDWSGTWSASFSGYFLIDDRRRSRSPATGARVLGLLGQRRAGLAGICGYDPEARRQHPVLPRLLRQEAARRTPACSASRRRRSRSPGVPFTVTVTAYSDAERHAERRRSGATVSGGGAQREDRRASGTAKLRSPTPAASRCRSRAPHAVRTEARVCVETAAARTCG